jgi:subtilisin family serine protease
MSSQRFKGAALFATAFLALQMPAGAQTNARLEVASLALGAPVSATAQPPARAKLSGTRRVILRLSDAPLVVAMGANAKRTGGSMTLAQRQAYMATLKAKQDALVAQVKALGGTELARLGKGYNAVIVSAPAAKLAQLSQLSGVVAMKEVVDHRLSLATTVPYIGASALQALGVTGAGVKIAVLDTGIDYTHYNLGGSGTSADYAAASANPTALPAGLFPTAKVIGGYDFVGGSWPNSAEAPDPNPIDAGTGAGHGTHVADIAAGASLDGLHKGVAPGAQLYAVKVCSSVATSCSGIAILEGLEWSMDPHGDLSFTDSADVVNLSLGSSYGQRDDDSTAMVSNVVRFGIVVAVAAGNSADRPYIVSSPSIAPEAISVAQTQVPTASTFAVRVNSPAAIAGSYGNTATVDWAPVGAGFSGDVAYIGRGCPAGAVSAGSAADPLLANPAGKVALIDRGACSVSLKVDYAAKAGAKAVLIGLVASGDAVSFSNGGGDTFVPTLVIQQSLSGAIKANIGAPVNVTVDSSTRVALAGSMASTSARGPGIDFSALKPEIGAPGASVSAIYGTGNGQEAFGGTSGATPMIAGSAALILQKYPASPPSEVKARLMNSAFRTIYTNPATLPGELAPVSRIGAGEVRVDRAVGLTTGVWDSANPYSVGLAFGTVRAVGVTTLTKKIAVRNYGSSARTYAIATSFRYANDAANGAVKFSAPASISVGPNATAAFTLTLTLDSSKLPLWNLGFAGDQGTGALLQQVEYDGYLSVSDAAETATVPWHILPHKAANVAPDATTVALAGGSTGSLAVSNSGGATEGLTDVYALTGTSPQTSTVLNAYGGLQPLVDLKAVGVRSVGSALQFAISTWGERAFPAYPGGFEIDIDVNNDGVADYAIYTGENGGFALTGQTLVYVANLAAGTAVAKYYADEDLNSSNMVYTVEAADVGVTSTTQKISFNVIAYDNYYTGATTDVLAGMVYTPGIPRYTVSSDEFTTPVGGSFPLTLTKVAAGAAASPSQTGFLLLHADARTGRESDIVTVTP